VYEGERTVSRPHRRRAWWVIRIFWISFLAFQVLFTALAAIAQIDVVLALLFLPNPEDSDGIIIFWPLAIWMIAEVVLSPITALAVIAMVRDVALASGLLSRRN
jgi:uncharacterized membrane protein